MAILSKAYKPDNFELHDSLELSFMSIWGFIQLLLIANLSLNKTLLTFLLCARQTYMIQLILAISQWEVSSTHMHGLAVYVKEGLSFA